jgi:sugar phosphate permease
MFMARDSTVSGRLSALVTVGSFPPGAEAAVYRKVTWRLLPFLMACYVVAYLDRVNVGFAKLQMLDDLKFSETVYGLGAGMFFIGYFCSKSRATSSCTASGRASGSDAS